MIGIRTRDLRKVYHAAPPFAAGGGFGPPAARGKQKKQPKPEIVALDGLSLDISPGEVFGLLGPNGAGKSTTVGILTTRVQPSGGQAWIGDHEVWKEQVAVKRLIGVVAQRPNLDFSLTAREILVFHGAYFGQDSEERAKRAEALLDRFKLLLWEIIREYNQTGKTILLTTNNMEEADALAHRLAIIDHGRNIALGTPAELKASVPGGFLLRLRFGQHSADLLQRLQSLAGVTEVRVIGQKDGQSGSQGVGQNDEQSGADLYADRGGSLIAEIASLASAAGVELRDVHISEPSLENLFLHHTGRSLRE